MPPDQYFLLLYRLPDRSVEITEFQGNYEAAATAYTQREEELRGNDETEVVLVGADSLDTIKKTHSHYFLGGGDVTTDLFDVFLESSATS